MPVGIAVGLEQVPAVWAVRRGLDRRMARREVPRRLDPIAVNEVHDGSPDQALLLARDCRWRKVVESPRRDGWLVRPE